MVDVNDDQEWSFSLWWMLMTIRSGDFRCGGC